MNALNLILGLYSGLITLLMGFIVFAIKKFIETVNKNIEKTNLILSELKTSIEVIKKDLKNGYVNLQNLDSRLTKLEESFIAILERITKLEQFKKHNNDG